MPHRLVIFADVHVGLPDWDCIQLLQRAVDETIQLSPQKVVLLGDMVNRGFPQEYDRVKQILAPLADRLEPMVGNHELQRAGVKEFQAAWNVPAVRETTLCSLPAIILNSALEKLPDSQWQGQLDAAQVDRLQRFLSEHRRQPVLVLCHHPVAGTVRKSCEPMFSLESLANVAEILSGHGSPVIFLSAHTHAQSVVNRGLVT